MKNNAPKIWNDCLAYIKTKLSNELYQAWFSPTKGIKFENNKLTIEVPSRYYYEWLEEHYIGLLRESISKVIGPDAQLGYSVVIKKRPS